MIKELYNELIISNSIIYHSYVIAVQSFDSYNKIILVYKEDISNSKEKKHKLTFEIQEIES